MCLIDCEHPASGVEWEPPDAEVGLAEQWWCTTCDSDVTEEYTQRLAERAADDADFFDDWERREHMREIGGL